MGCCVIGGNLQAWLSSGQKTVLGDVLGTVSLIGLVIAFLDDYVNLCKSTCCVCISTLLRGFVLKAYFAFNFKRCDFGLFLAF